MRKTVISLMALLLSVTMVFSLAGCSKSNKEIENLIAKFEQACNDLDFEEVLDCINPKISDKIKLAAGLVGMFTDTDTDEMFETLAKYLSSDNLGGADFFSSIKIEVKDISVKDDSADVSVMLNYEVNGEEIAREATFKCIYYTEKWYVSSFTID